VNTGPGEAQLFAQLRLFFYCPVRHPDGSKSNAQFALVRWFKHNGQPDVLTRHGCTRIRWEGQGSAGEYQVIPLATIIRKVYVAPDFTEPTGTAFYTSPFMAERGVPDKRHGEDL
jgi:hypothetical protein